MRSKKCLKTATNSNPDSNPKPPKKGGNSPTVATSRMVFEGKDGLIEDFVDKAEEEIDNRPENDKSCVKSIEVDGVKIDIPVQAVTEKLVQMAVSDMQWGGIIEADVVSPKEALDNADKYGFEQFDNEFIDRAKTYLIRASDFPEAKTAATAVLSAFNNFLEARRKLLPYAKRLQDMPMLQIVARCTIFSAYLKAYERLLLKLKIISRIYMS